MSLEGVGSRSRPIVHSLLQCPRVADPSLLKAGKTVQFLQVYSSKFRKAVILMARVEIVLRQK